MKKYIPALICFLLFIVLLQKASAMDGYRREIHLVETNMPYLYFPTGEGVYIIKSGYETVYYPFADSSGRSKPTYQFYSAGFPIIDVVCNRGFTPASYVAATTNVGDSNLLLYVDRNGTTDITPAFIAKGSKSRIEQIEMQNGDGLLPSKYALSVFLSVSGSHAGVYRHSQMTSATKHYPEWTKIFDGPVNFISADAYGYEFVICYDDSLGNSHVIISEDKGICEKWRELYSTNKFRITNIERSGNFYCIYGKEMLAISTDNAATWTERRTPFAISDIVYTKTNYGEVSYNEIYAAEASDTISRMWLSQDLGATWSVQHTIADDPTGIVDMCLGTNCAYSFVMYTGVGKIYSLLHDYGNIRGNKDREILFNGTATAIGKEIKPDALDFVVTPADGGCLVTLDTDTGEWTATLYNSNGVTVAQQQGNGSEIFLSTDSKGTHILVVKAGGRVVKKKIQLR